MVESNKLICADMAVEELNMESKESQAEWEECEKQMREHGIVVISASDDAESDAEAWERPSEKLKKNPNAFAELHSDDSLDEIYERLKK